MVKRLTSIVAIVAAIALGSLLVSAPKTNSSLRYGQVKTDGSKSYLFQASAERSMFVEKVLLTRSMFVEKVGFNSEGAIQLAAQTVK